jgi:hypothetical protein
VFLRCTFTDKFADNYKTGGNANAHPQTDTGGSPQLRYRLDKTQPGVDSALRIMLMRSGVTEIGKHTIAQVSGDETAGLVDFLGTAVVIRADHLPQILWVKFCRESGRTDKITKHNGKLATFGSVWRLGRMGSYCLGLSDDRGRDNCCQHFPSMPERDTKFLKVSIAQMAEDRNINVVLGKALRVIGHAERRQPIFYGTHWLPLG